MIALSDAGPPPAAAPDPPTRAPEVISLTAGSEATVEVRYASPSGGRASVLWHRTGGRPCALLFGDWTRGSMLVDRDGSKRFRLISRDEKAYDLTWEAGRLALRHAGRVVRLSRPLTARCVEAPGSVPDESPRL